jgi:hypothetical protein
MGVNKEMTTDREESKRTRGALTSNKSRQGSEDDIDYEYQT